MDIYIYIYIYIFMCVCVCVCVVGIRATGREVGFVLGVLSYPRIGSSVPGSASPAG